MADSASEKRTKGQRVIPLKKIESSSALAAAFCKRRMGLFKKANEICTLCAAQIAIIIFSPSGHSSYTFGHPNVDSVMNDLPRHVDQVKIKNAASAVKLCDELAEVRKEANKCQQSYEELTRIINDNKKKNWWRKPIGDMSLSEVEECKKVMEELMAVAPEDTVSSFSEGVDLDLVL